MTRTILAAVLAAVLLAGCSSTGPASTTPAATATPTAIADADTMDLAETEVSVRLRAFAQDQYDTEDDVTDFYGPDVNCTPADNNPTGYSCVALFSIEHYQGAYCTNYGVKVYGRVLTDGDVDWSAQDPITSDYTCEFDEFDNYYGAGS